jgi:hypothetical protein
MTEEADFVPSAAERAVIVTILLDIGTLTGAVYRPLAVTVPISSPPPGPAPAEFSGEIALFSSFFEP